MRGAILVILFILIVCSRGFAEHESRNVCFKQSCVQAEVAASEPERLQGLMLRDSLAESAGMLFVFDREAIYPFWMKNMRFPIDIIWMSADKHIVEILSDASPCGDACTQLVPVEPSLYVLEVCAGFVKRHDIKVGDQAVLY